MRTHLIYPAAVYVLLSCVRSDGDLDRDNSHPNDHNLNIKDPPMKEQRNRSHSQLPWDSEHTCGVDILSTKHFIQDFRLTCVYKGKTIDKCGSTIRCKDTYWEIPRDPSTDSKPFIQIDVSPLVNPLIEQVNIQGNVKTVKILMIQDPAGKRRYSPIQGSGIFNTNETITFEDPKPSATFIKIVIMDLRNSNDTKFRINISMKCCIGTQAMTIYKCCVQYKVSTECMPMCWGIQRFMNWPLCFYLYSHIQKSCEDGSPVERPWPWLLSSTEDVRPNSTGKYSNNFTSTALHTTNRASTGLTHNTGLTYALSVLLIARHVGNS